MLCSQNPKLASTILHYLSRTSALYKKNYPCQLFLKCVQYPSVWPDLTLEDSGDIGCKLLSSYSESSILKPFTVLGEDQSLLLFPGHTSECLSWYCFVVKLMTRIIYTAMLCCYESALLSMNVIWWIISHDLLTHWCVRPTMTSAMDPKEIKSSYLVTPI